MMNNKLIILEGLPGSGKTTTSRKIFEKIESTNKTLIQEFTNPHPIKEDNITNIDEWTIKTLENWQKFSEKIIAGNKIYIMEFALFQNTICEMLLKNCSKNQIIDIMNKIQNIIKPVLPALILFKVDDTNTFLEQTYKLRSDKWKNKIKTFIDNTEYGKQNCLTGVNGWLDFSSDYVKIRDEIFDKLDIKRISINVTDRNWNEVEEQTCKFLEI